MPRPARLVEQQKGTDAFADIANKDDATFDADVLLCYRTCLSRPVPAIADPCAGLASDIAYSRICEQAALTSYAAPPRRITAPPRLIDCCVGWPGCCRRMRMIPTKPG